MAKWSFAPAQAPVGSPSSWEVLLRLAAIFMGMAERPIKEIDDAIFSRLAAAAAKNRPWPGLNGEEIVAKLNDSIGPERVIDMLLRIGPYGDGFGRRPEGLTLDRVKASKHGIDLGPLQPRLREILNTKSQQVELAPAGR